MIALISNGDEETPEGKLRSNALYALCDMNPGQALQGQNAIADAQIKSKRSYRFGM